MTDSAPDPRYGRGGMAWHAVIVMGATVLSRLLGVVRQSVIADRFGTSSAYAAYEAAFGVPDTIYLLVIGGALGSAFIPVFSAYLARRDDAGAWRLASTVLNLALAVAIGTAGLAFLLAPWLVRWIVAPGFCPAQQALTTRLVRLLLLQPILLGLGGLAMAILNTFRRFLLTSLAPLAYNLSIIAGALFLAPRWGIDGLVAGVLAGAALYLIAMLPGLVLCRMRYGLSFAWSDRGVREVGRLLGPRVLGQMAFQANFLAVKALASFRGSLGVTAIVYAYRLLNFPLGILGTSLGTVAFPTLSALANEARMEAFRQTLARVLRVVLFLSLPATALLLVLRAPVVRLLFERGVFSPDDTVATAHALLFFILGLAAACVAEIVLRAFYALHDTRTPVIVAVAAMVLNVSLGAGLVHLMGFAGLALAFSVADVGQAAGLLFFLRRRLGTMGGRELLRSAVRSSLATLAAAGAVALVQPWAGQVWPGEGLLTQLLRLTVLTALGVGLYLGVATLLRSPELREVWQMLRRRREAARG